MKTPDSKVPNSIQMILVSACLLGERIRFNGSDAFCGDDTLYVLQNQGRLLPFCPELAAGMPIPRPPAEIVGGTGEDVWSGKARVMEREGNDITWEFLTGAKQTWQVMHAHQIQMAILKDGSPSCGTTCIYDGTFSHATIPGMGVAAACLAAHNVRVFSERQLKEAEAYLQTLRCG